jgi:hypothetical protein
MQTRYESSARVQPTEGKYLAHPGTCAICGKVPSNMEEIFANPLIELEQYGYIYFCTACCFEVGSFVMMVPSDEAQYLKAAVNGLETSLRNAKNENTYLRGLLDARISAAGSGESDSDGVVSIPLFEVESGQDSIDSLINGLQSESA